MENASKALLIAGAILVCILLIGVGMLVYTSAQGSVSEGLSQMSSQEKDLFNQQFQQYEGTRVSGSNVRALINKVNSNNTQNADMPEKLVEIITTGNNAPNIGGTSGTSYSAAKINTAGTYTVLVEDKGNSKNAVAGDGLMDTITISYNSSNS